MSSSAPTRRNGHNPPSSKPPPPTSTQTSPSPSASPLTALLPTPAEFALLLIYPLLLLLGSLYSTLSPQTRSSPYNPTTQSHPPETAPSYFALKRNLPNTYFVKIAWFWVTTSYAVFLLTHPSHGGSSGYFVLTPKKLRGVVRWVIVTMWWGVVTQWFFGPGLIDRGFTVTGGACELAERFEGEGGGMEFVTGQACKAVGGTWRGGHDISGHVFILVLGSAFLGLEVLPVVVRGREERRVRWGDGRVGRVERVDGGEGGEEESGRWGVGAVLGVMGMSWWMLLMTATFFHTWFEKLTGLLVAMVGVFVVYFLPRALPAMRDIVGMPGI